MELSNLQSKLNVFIKKYKYVIAVVVIGVVLMSIPTGKKKKVNKSPTAVVQVETDSTEKMLADILSNVQGAGKVEVFLTTMEGEKTIYQTNDDGAVGNSADRTQTVTVTDSDRNQVGLVKQVNPPLYRGAIVVCEGADDPAVQYAIMDAVAKVTGLGTNRISVLKMK